MANLILKLALVATALAISSATTLRLLGAGVGTAPGIQLANGFSICAADYPNGVSVICEAPNASAAVFYVNGAWQRREGVAPFAINGDNAGNLFAWAPPTGSVNIECKPVGQPAVTVVGTFSCDATASPVPPPAASLIPVPTVSAAPAVPALPTVTPAPVAPSGVAIRAVRAGAGGNSNTIETLGNGFSLCPTDYAEGIALVCDAPGAASATFEVNDVFNNKENFAPFTIEGDSNGFVNKWTSYPSGAVKVKCFTPSGAAVTVSGTICGAPAASTPAPAVTPAPSVAAVAPVGVDASYCVGINATSYVGALAQDWKVVGDSLFFREFDDRTNIVGPNFAKLTYKFTVPVASTYGFTLDMDVGGDVDYNDVFVTLVEGGWTVRGNNKQSGEPQELQFTGATKAYHNNPNGRHKLAFTVDFNPHTFSSKNVLQPGTEYTLVIAGRSSKVQLWGAVLFPCSGDQCKVGVSHWQTYIGLCNV